MRVLVVRNIAAEVANDPLIFVVEVLDVERQVMKFNSLVAMRTAGASMILRDVLVELRPRLVALHALRFGAPELEQTVH